MNERDETKELHAACRKILEAGVWLIRNGYGRMAILPYAAPSGCYWRCEFHPVEKPSKAFFRYSTGSGSKYLQNHCGGSIPKNVSPEKIANAIMVSVSNEHKELCYGEATPETLRWLDSLERALNQGYIPEAFHEYTEDFSRWKLIGHHGMQKSSIDPQPGYVLPGNEKTWRDDGFWRMAIARWKGIVDRGAFPFDPVQIDRLPYDDTLAIEFTKAVKDAWIGDMPDIIKATLSTLIHKLQNNSIDDSRLNASTVPLPISLSAPDDPMLRRASRVLAMVHELHKAGYQKLRVCCGISADEKEWRCYLFPSQNVRENGWMPVKVDLAHTYTSNDGNHYFGWEDATNDDARKLAAKFITRFPETVAACVGNDWAYTGWLTSVLGAAENGNLPVFYGGLGFVPTNSHTPFPPTPFGTSRTLEISDDRKDDLLSNNELTYNDLPPPNARYDQLWQFCLTYDGYHGGLRTINDCFYIANYILQHGLENASLDNLRTTAFIHQRKIKNYSDMLSLTPRPVELEESLKIIHDIVDELRRRLKIVR